MRIYVRKEAKQPQLTKDTACETVGSVKKVTGSDHAVDLDGSAKTGNSGESIRGEVFSALPSGGRLIVCGPLERSRMLPFVRDRHMSESPRITLIIPNRG